MSIWRRLVGDRPIVTRLVVAVAGTMTVVLLAAGALVFWRVQFALNRQLDQDLDAYAHVVDRAVAVGSAPPGQTPGQSYQVYDERGRVASGDATVRLVDPATVTRTAAGGHEQRLDVGRLLPAAADPYRVVTARVTTARGTVVVAAAISRSKHDEALRELLLQLLIADLATLVAASLVGYGVARAALTPVERYRVAAEQTQRDPGRQPVLPVAEGKDDEISRLGHTFNALLERISAANERERQFLADASHELRSPLAVMRAEIEVALLRPRGEQETRLAFTSLAHQVERLIALSNALLDLEELRATGVAPGLEVDLDALVTGVVRRHTPQAEAAGRSLEFSLGTPRESRTGAALAAVPGHQHWLDLALGNLVSNALRHGRGPIRVEVGQTPERTRLSVRDEGPGFPDDFAAKAFDRFSRADSSRTTPGTGLGLALVEAVADAHGGTTGLEGACVWIDLPSTGAATP